MYAVIKSGGKQYRVKAGPDHSPGEACGRSRIQSSSSAMC